jgi:hypothetical protein
MGRAIEAPLKQKNLSTPGRSGANEMLHSKSRGAAKGGLISGALSGGLLDGCSVARGMEKPHSESCHQRKNYHHAEQQPGDIRGAKLSNSCHMSHYIQ